MGGVFLDPGGHTMLTLEWGLGMATDNQVECFALYQGIVNVVHNGIQLNYGILFINPFSN